MKVQKGDTVKVDYTGTLEDGTVFDTSTHSDHSHPLVFEVGGGMVIPGFENAILGMAKDEEKDIKLQPEDAYGQPDDRLVQEVPKEHLPENLELKEGMVLLTQLPDGQQIPATLVKIAEKTVTFDLNPPLAGKVLNFHLKVIEITKAGDKKEEKAEKKKSEKTEKTKKE